VFNIVLLLVGLQSIKGIFAFHPFRQKFDVQQLDSNTLRVLHWNTMSFGEFDKNRVNGSEVREKMFAYIKEKNPDVICLMEFFDSFHPEFSQNIEYFSNRLGYPYYYYGKDYERWATVKNKSHIRIGYWGTIILSKYAMTDTGKIAFTKDYKGKNGNLCYATITKNNKPVRVLTTHLQSIRLGKPEYEVFENLPTNEETTIQKSKTALQKIKRAYSYRKKQADIIRAELDRVNIPQIITGDFNDVPNSYTYATIKGNMQDAFLKNGFGIGRTFSNISPTLRIDYILATKDLKVTQFNKDVLNLSDHYPIIADFKLPQ
jgi:endonuclease/exonuclease/phosphatase family metal-dependent hydrolase